MSIISVFDNYQEARASVIGVLTTFGHGHQIAATLYRMLATTPSTQRFDLGAHILSYLKFKFDSLQISLLSHI